MALPLTPDAPEPKPKGIFACIMPECEGRYSKIDNLARHCRKKHPEVTRGSHWYPCAKTRNLFVFGSDAYHWARAQVEMVDDWTGGEEAVVEITPLDPAIAGPSGKVCQ